MVEGYEFDINKKENQKTYNMEIILPLIAGWREYKFEDAVSSKAYEFLQNKYAEELKGA